MYLSDYHTHCSLSFDSKTPVEDMVRAGIAQGLQEMCLTDHVDLFRPRETAHWEHDFSNREETFARADQAADGKIIVRRGIELGEAMRDFAYADELLSRLPELDFVIGSQHQLSEKYDWNDLYFMPEATEQEAREQIADYLTLVLETAKWGKFSVLGHLTLPLRYMNENHGMHMSFDGFEDEVAQVFRALIENGCGIECNVNRGNTPISCLPPPTACPARKFLRNCGRRASSSAISTRRAFPTTCASPSAPTRIRRNSPACAPARRRSF